MIKLILACLWEMSWALNKYQTTSIITSSLNVVLITSSSSGIRKGNLSLAYDEHGTFPQTERLDSIYERLRATN